MTNDEIIELASEVNGIIRALDQSELDQKGDDDPEVRELGSRLDQVIGRVPDREHILIMLATKMLGGEPCSVMSDNPETMRRVELLAADLGARNIGAWKLPGASGTGVAFAPPDKH